MNIEKLRYMLEIERCGTINKAARNLFVSQPHLSKSLKTLEESLGIILFQRTKQGVIVTGEGKEFLQYARAIVGQMDFVTEKYGSRKHCELKMKISSMRSAGFMESFVGFMEMYRQNQSMLVTFKETGPFDVLEDVRNGVADIGFIFNSLKERAFFQNIIKANGLEHHRIASFKACVAMSKQNKLADEGPIDLSRLRQFTYVTYGEYENTLLDANNEHKMVDLEAPEKVILVYDRNTLFEFLSRKEYYTVCHKMSRDITERYGLTFIPTGEPQPEAEVGYVKSPEKILTPEEERLIGLIQSRYSSFYQTA